ncbi:hypothetical protein ADEAN_000313200 [Angomonas deanei]|uniref:Symplekin C-terminal domain-containing protein n=1 Tax=Angomonas deanei TaxID=59799 RepID=A0A7G2C9Y1_9TRYP|nr:hypothetical protein ADEAN_000313200 [Angomonas deanei]
MKERATKEGQQWCARVLALMKARPDAMAEGDLSCEVVTSFLEELSPLQEIHPEAPEILFRCCRAVIAQAEVSQLMRLYRVVSQLPKVPFLLFRILGKCVMRGASQMPADHALLWLELYVHQNIRDDGVAKVLLKRVTDGAATALDVKTLDARVRKCAVFFGQSSQFQKVKQKAASTNKKKKKKVISYDYSNFV